jgi:hypothetical protein
MAGAPVGRLREWQALVDRLGERKSGLIVIEGEPGSGRSHLLGHLGAYAAENGYRVAGCDGQLVIERTTQISDVYRALGAVLEVPTRMPGEPQGILSSIVETLKAAYTDERGVRDVIEQVGDVLIGIDGFAPSDRIDEWFRQRLLPWIGESHSTVVIAVVDRPERLGGIRPHADLVVTLETLDLDELREYFGQLAATVDPPLSADEIDCYTEASADPSVFSALDTLVHAVARRDVA